jgi:threonine dehydratase
MKMSLSEILAARQAIAATVARTPLLPSRFLSEAAGTPFYLKMETMQRTGAFKLRGATNAARNAPTDTTTLTCCSTGNHGRAVAFAAQELGLKAVICMSALVPQTKVDGIRALGAEVRIAGTSQNDAAAVCRALAQEAGVFEIPPFDDPFVVAGQGTIGLEILEDLPDLRTLLVPLSGGGLAAGVALAAKAINPTIQVVGISMNRGAAMIESVLARKPVEVEEVASLADSLGGGIGLENRLTFDLCRDHLDEFVLVTEEEIYRAMQVLFFEDSHIAEGGSVVGIAALIAGKLKNLEGPVATILSGRNVDMNQVINVMTGQDLRLGSYLVKGVPYGA